MTGRVTRQSMAGWTRMPEFNVAVFAFLLNLVWEFAQVRAYAGLPTLSHADGITLCMRATVGDVAIALVAFWVASVLVRTRCWIERGNRRAALVYVVAGVLITVVIEWLSTHVWGRWSYGPQMPRLPGLGTGLTPLLQWLLVPPLGLWFARRQMR